MLTKKQNFKGVSLYVVLMVLSILLGISLGLNSLFVGQLKIFVSAEDSVSAFYAADTGIERNLFEMQESYTNIPLFDGGATFSVETVCNPDFDYCATFCPTCNSPASCTAPRFCMTSNGEFNGVKRALFVKF